MGLFDSVYLMEPFDGLVVPDGVKLEEVEWQTKSLGDPFMSSYRIMPDGSVQVRHIDGKEYKPADLSMAVWGRKGVPVSANIYSSLGEAYILWRDGRVCEIAMMPEDVDHDNH